MELVAAELLVGSRGERIPRRRQLDVIKRLVPIVHPDFGRENARHPVRGPIGRRKGFREGHHAAAFSQYRYSRCCPIRDRSQPGTPGEAVRVKFGISPWQIYAVTLGTLVTIGWCELDDRRSGTEPFDHGGVDKSESRIPCDRHALVDFHTRFHGWRLFAEDHLDITLDELLDISAPGREDGVGVTHGILEIDEQLCENILSLKRDYLEAYPAIVEEWTDESEEIDVDLDNRAKNFAEGIAEAVDLQ